MPNYVKVVPSIAIAFVSYEQVRDCLQPKHLDELRYLTSDVLFVAFVLACMPATLLHCACCIVPARRVGRTAS